MAATRNRPVSRARKNQNSKFKRFLIAVNPTSPRKRLVIFVLVFAVIGASYIVYSKAAVSVPVFHLNNQNDGSAAETVFALGNPGDVPISCDWDGNRSDGIGVWRNSNITFYLSDTVNPTKVNRTLPFGNPGDIPVCGDWDGNGRAGVGVYRPSEGKWYLSNEVAPNKVSHQISWGNPGDIPVVCDWDGNGRDDIGLYRPGNQTFYLSFSTLGWTDRTIPFGNPGDIPVCGNWDGVGLDGLGIYRPSNNTFYLSDTTNPTNVNIKFNYGNPGDKPIVGDWDGNGTTNVGIMRLADLPAPAASSSDLRPGSSGAAVSSLQQRLAGRGFWIANTGQYNAATETTVKWFQATRRIPVTGIANAATMGQLAAAEAEGWRFNPNDPLLAPLAAPPAPAPAPAPAAGTPTLQLGASGSAVASLQQRLANRGFWIGVSGNFDQATLTTVKWFQSVRSIGADGVVGPQTWGQLAAAEAEGWRFNPNDPLLAPVAAPSPVSVNPGTGGPPPTEGLTPEAIAFLEAWKRAEEEERRKQQQPQQPPAPVEVPRKADVGRCDLWRLSGGQWILIDRYWVVSERTCWELHGIREIENIHHIDWIGPNGKTIEVWPVRKAK